MGARSWIAQACRARRFRLRGRRRAARSRQDYQGGGDGEEAQEGEAARRSRGLPIPSLIQFEDTCEPGEEVVFRLEQYANFTQDGQFWLKAENNDTNVTSFTCTSHECTATKHVEIYDTETLVRYRGPHCHMRPVISTRNNGDRTSVPGPARPAVFKNTSSESASGSRGSLEDVCNVLAIEGEI